MILFEMLLVLFTVFNTTFSIPQYQKARRPNPLFKNLNELCTLVATNIQILKNKNLCVQNSDDLTGGLMLPHNATAIRASIVDTFSCTNKIYGFYADMENDCQIFHVCFPQKMYTLRWSFICPAETVFNQATFVCTRTENSIPCKDSENYYVLNQNLGKDEDIIPDSIDNSLNTQNKHFK